MTVSHPPPRRVLRAAACLAAALLLPAAGMFAQAAPEAAAPEPALPEQTLPEPDSGSPGEPYRLLRTLQSIQDRTAHGSREALKLQSPLLSQIEQQLLATPDAAWQEPRNARAALSFVLSGGSPVILRKLARLDPPPAVAPELLKGVLAYVEGDEEEALAQLENIDPRALAPGLDGRIALVQSTLLARRDPETAMARLDLSRLLLPGTLIDEGALRREMFFAGQLGKREKFKTLAKHYLQRYPRSVYAGDFHQRFSAALVRLDMTGTEEEARWLSDLLAALDRPAQININLILARQALSQGKTRMAALGATRALELASEDSTARERAKLYQAAAIIVNENEFAQGKQALLSIDRKRLPPDDVGLLESAIYLATRIRDLPGMPEAPAPRASDEAAAVAERAGGGMEPQLDATVTRIRQLISDSDRLIDEELGS
ncbi:chemotaxis protein MotC [Pseudochelatococcus lubricantis]|uniref:chemotaxis protein MotC n=1 Tax=Pseudochelatococcus lubricantis TaxID=1538102 RepID=UPI0035E4A78F